MVNHDNAAYGQVSLELNRHIVNLLDSLSALAALADLPVAGLDQRQLLQKALAALMDNQDLERCSIFLLAEDGDELVNAAGLDWDDLLTGGAGPPSRGRDEAREQRRAPSRFRLGEGIIGQAAASGELAECRSIAADPRFKKPAQERRKGEAADGSLLCVPIRSEERVLGVLNVFYPEPAYFTIWHQRLLLLFCTMLGRLLINRELFAEMEQLVARRTDSLAKANSELRAEVQRRRQAEDEVAEQRRFLQMVIDGCAEPIMVIGHDYRLRWMNLAARELAADGRQQKFCYQLSHKRVTPCDSAEHPCPLRTVLSSGQATKVVHEHYDSAGQPRAVEILATPFPGPEGEPAGIIESCRDVTERVLTEAQLREKQEELHTKAYYDALTGLPNRLFFNLRLHHVLRQAAAAALLFIDLDGFKRINDEYGHLFADRLLQVVGKRLRQMVRQHDLVARFAGDEFVVLLEKLEHGPDDAGLVADKLLATLTRPVTLEHTEIRVGASIGVACFPADATDPEQLLEQADQAMFKAKKAGKNTWRRGAAG